MDNRDPNKPIHANNSKVQNPEECNTGNMRSRDLSVNSPRYPNTNNQNNLLERLQIRFQHYLTLSMTRISTLYLGSHDVYNDISNARQQLMNILQVFNINNWTDWMQNLLNFISRWVRFNVILISHICHDICQDNHTDIIPTQSIAQSCFSGDCHNYQPQALTEHVSTAGAISRNPTRMHSRYKPDATNQISSVHSIHAHDVNSENRVQNEDQRVELLTQLSNQKIIPDLNEGNNKETPPISIETQNNRPSNSSDHQNIISSTIKTKSQVSRVKRTPSWLHTDSLVLKRPRRLLTGQQPTNAQEISSSGIPENRGINGKETTTEINENSHSTSRKHATVTSSSTKSSTTAGTSNWQHSKPLVLTRPKRKN